MERKTSGEIICLTQAVNEQYSGAIPTSRLSVDGRVEISVVTLGEGVCRILGETVECKSGDLFLFDKGLPHSFFAEGGREMRILSVSFSPEALDGDGEEQLRRIFVDGMPYSCSVLNSAAMGEICRLMGLIRRETDGREIDFERAARAYLLLLLITVDRYLCLADLIERERPRQWPLIISAMGEVEKRYWESTLTLSAVAESLFVSPSRLSRAFLSSTGEKFSDYLRGVRIKAATAMLERSEMNNEDIATGCGFRDMPTFYAAFKESLGVTPKKYREMMNNGKKTERGDNKMVTVNEISEMLQKGRAKAVKSLVEQAIGEGLSAEVILSEGLIGGMAIIGERFKKNEVFVPEVLVAARAMNMGLEALKPILDCGALMGKGRVCIGTVRGDLHDIGKNLVKIMMESRGLEVIDLGTDVSPEKFIEAAIANECQVISCSALLTTTMPVMAEVVKAAEAAGIRDKVKIMVGGAPVSEEFCREIGADAYCVDAASAAEVAVGFCG